jgi:hypothetical protein
VTSCTPSCSGKQCGDDGCGASCGSCSAGSTCSTLGDCIALEETPGDGLENTSSTSRRTGETTQAKTGLTLDSLASSFTAFFTGNPQQSQGGAEEEPTQAFWILGRWTGMLAYLLLALSILVGVYRLWLIRRWKRDIVIRLHSIISYVALVLVVTHLAGLILDQYSWGSSLRVTNSLLPSFASSTDTYLALGVLGAYLMIIGVISCILFKATIKKVGYNTWLWGHRLTLVSYIFVYVHAWKLGTDFNNIIYLIIFQILFFFIIGKFAHDFLDRHHLMGRIKPFNTVETKEFNHEAVEPIEQVQFDRARENQAIHIQGDLMYNRYMHNFFWYIVSDGSAHLWAYSATQLNSGVYAIKGILRFFKDQPYIEIREMLPLTPGKNR